MGEIDDGSAPAWRTTQIVYATPTARRALLVDALGALDDAAGGPWFWVDLRRPTDAAEEGVVEVAIAIGEHGVPTQWFRDAVARGLIERAAAIECSSALDRGLFPRQRVPAAYPELLAATSRQALLLVRGDHDDVGRSWAVVREEIAAIYEALVPEPATRRVALLEYAEWLERTVAAGGGPSTALSRHDAPEPVPADHYQELGAWLRGELGQQDLVVSVGRLAHTQVLRLQPDGVNGARQEVRIVRDLADHVNDRSGATRSGAKPSTTVFDQAARQLALVSEAVGARSRDRGVALLRDMAPRCGDRDDSDLPRWSCLGDDCSPFEISLATSRAGHEVRVLVEAQSDPASPERYWDAGCRLSRWLAAELGLDLRRFDAVADLFGPASHEAFWAMWHGVDLGDEPVVKVYLNPRLGGRAPDAVVHEVLSRLGFGSAWAAVEAAAAGGATPSHVSLDLGGEGSRVKVYLRHAGDAARSLLDVPRGVSTTAAGDFAVVWAVMCGDDSLLGSRPPFTTLYFTDPEAGTPERVALHLPVQSYLPDDAVASSRIRSLLQSFALDTSGYDRAFAALSAESLLTRGLNSYVGFQRDQSGPRVTTYFGARLYAERHGWAARAPSRVWPAPLPSR